MVICPCLIHNTLILMKRTYNKIDKAAIWIYFKNACSLILFYLIFFTLKKQRTPHPKNLLFINTGQIGDLIINTTLMVNENLFDQESEIFLLIKKEYKELFKSYNGRIKFIFWNSRKYKRSLIYRYQFLNVLQKHKLKTTVNLTTARGPINDELTLLSGANEKYCLSNNFRYLRRVFKNIYNKHYTKVLDYKNVTEFEKQIKVLEFLTFKSPREAVHLDISEEQSISVRQYFSKYFKKPSDKFVIVQPFSDLEVKNWPAENYKSLLQKLNNLGIIIFCQGNEKQRVKIELLIQDLENVHNIAGELSLIESAALLSFTELYIGNDSGFTHIAKALNTNSIAIIGCGSYGIFFPYLNSNCERLMFKTVSCFGCEWRCIHPKRFCLDDVTANEVFEIACEILNY